MHDVKDKDVLAFVLATLTIIMIVSYKQYKS